MALRKDLILRSPRSGRLEGRIAGCPKPDGNATTMTNNSPLSGDDSALPDDERALLERARALIPRLAERAPAATAARRVPSGWRLSGRYTFSSGCDFAQWAILGAFLGEAGDPRTIAYLLVPLAEIEIVDDWQVLGLAGTGSKSLLLHDVFIPEHRC